MPGKSRKHRTVVEEIIPEDNSTKEKEKEKSPPPDDSQSPDESAPKQTESQAQETLNELHELSPKNKKPARKTNYKLIFVVTIFTALIVGFVSGGVYVYFSGAKSSLKPATPSSTSTPASEPQSTPTPPPSPSPAQDIDYSAYKVSVLNGSGKIGEAGKVQDILETEGFTVSNVANASRFDYESSLIEAKSDVPKDVISKLKSALSDSYEVETGDELASNSAYDIVITVGSE